jgi:hypothetical protein
MDYFEVSPAEQLRRLDQRLTDEPHTTWPTSEQELVVWSDIMQIPTPGEVDGSEPIDDPPAGFASWDQWRWDRWPPIDCLTATALIAMRAARTAADECVPRTAESGLADLALINVG